MFPFSSRPGSQTLTGLSLYYIPTCLFCWRVRLVMMHLGITLPLKNVLTQPTSHQELVTKGGRMQVPCLRIKEGDSVRWLYESGDIIKYLKQRVNHGS